MSFLSEAAEQLNLRWAYEKVRRASTLGDFWVDEIALAGFELELERNLLSIGAEFHKGRYRMSAIRPLPFPKEDDKDGKARIRQYFHVSIRDQVAWTAVVNVVGPHVDNKMPPWNYGNRLFRSRWVEEDEDGIKRIKIGRYRHSSGRLYLPFGQSWPVFRRHVYLTTGAMTAAEKLQESDEATEDEGEMQERLDPEHRCPFVVRDYWNERRPEAKEPELFWCSIDLERFYPNLNLRVVQDNIVEHLPPEWKVEAGSLLASMLEFPVDRNEWSDDDLRKVHIRPGSRRFRHIPTGLYASGFLANAGLLKVDLQVAELLKSSNVAHFRFVDDHIVLAYSFTALVEWVEQYVKLLTDAGTGARVNPDKVEPEELGLYFEAKKKGRRQGGVGVAAAAAEKVCKLDPQFPTPLMTKTLALVSAIARTDFNLLEEAELEALTNQLEHLLLVELPEEEIPERTRLSFAATRLTWLAECRLANDARQTELLCRKEAVSAALAREEVTSERRGELETEAAEVQEKLGQEDARLTTEVERAFGLLRKVLRERPDRVRLWTRAVRMCRQTGVRGLKKIVDDLEKAERNNRLAAEYLRGVILALLGTQVMVAARVLRDEGSAEWRRKAAHAFLQDACEARLEPGGDGEWRWFVRTSWEQFTLGVYCASLMLEDAGQGETAYRVIFPEKLLAAGKSRLERSDSGRQGGSWAWWAARGTLWNLKPGAEGFVKTIGGTLGPSRQGAAFWRFFPGDVPSEIFGNMALGGNRTYDVKMYQGWWYDALRGRLGVDYAELTKRAKPVWRVKANLASASGPRRISLYDWCERLAETERDNPGDPRSGEWTALEIVRQIASLMAAEPTFGAEYIKTAKWQPDSLPCLHPANFRLPKEWLKVKEPRWDQWIALVRTGRSERGVETVPRAERIVDVRYTPLDTDSPLFLSVNPVRGLGLLLYGLLRKSFALPALWNGLGHSDVLQMLPALLLREMTCSSWTLGVLEGCLWPRATENLLKQRRGSFDYYVNDDMLHDPVAFFSTGQVRDALAKCQSVLEGNQLSTMNHKARQLTPISIRQLTQPDWSKAFGEVPEEGVTNE